MLEIHDEETSILFQKPIGLFILSKGVKAFVVRDRWIERDEYRLLYWPITSYLDHTTLCYLPGLTSSLPTRRTKPVLAGGRASGFLSADSTDHCKLAPTDSLSDWNSREGICMYHLVTPTHFWSTTWLLPLIFTSASCVETMWLTARSSVNMQHSFKKTKSWWCPTEATTDADCANDLALLPTKPAHVESLLQTARGIGLYIMQIKKSSRVLNKMDQSPL